METLFPPGFTSKTLPRLQKNIRDEYELVKSINNTIFDRDKNGAKDFQGELIRFGSDTFPNWQRVTEYLYAYRLNTINDIDFS